MVAFEDRSTYSGNGDKFTINLVVPNLNAADYDELMVKLLEVIVGYKEKKVEKDNW